MSGTTPPAPRDDADGVITLRIRRSVLVGSAAALAVGLGAGFAIGRASKDGPAPAPPVAVATSPVATTPGAPPPQQDIDTAGRPSIGPSDAKVTVVEFTDYQCPYCKQFFDQTEKDLLKTYRGNIRFVVRNFPISTIHPMAQKAAEAAECALDQDRYWPYHDLLFTHQEALDEASLRRYAAEAGMDRQRFAACLSSGRKADVVQRDLQAGQRYGVRGTPTFFVNGKFVAGAKSLLELRSMIEPELR